MPSLNSVSIRLLQATCRLNWSTSLLIGVPASDKTQVEVIPSAAVLPLIANENVSFLVHYAGCIARAPLPETDKLAMLYGAAPRRDNSEEVHQCISASLQPQSPARNSSALPARDGKPALDSRIETDVADALSVSTHHGALLDRC